MRVLITGASGMTGGYLARHLIAAGHKVFATVRRNAVPDGVTPVILGGALPTVDVLVHAAATSPQPGVSARQIVFDGIMLTMRLLDNAVCPKIIYCSSISLHGNIEDKCVDQHVPAREPDVYGATKLLCERALADANVPTVGLRLPGVLGPGASRCWLARVAQKLLAGETVTISTPDAPFNNGVHVADLASFVDRLMVREWSGFHAMPLGAATMMPVHEVVDRLAGALGVKAQIRIGDAAKLPFTIDNSEALAWGYAPMSMAAMIDRFGDDMHMQRAVAA